MLYSTPDKKELVRLEGKVTSCFVRKSHSTKWNRAMATIGQESVPKGIANVKPKVKTKEMVIVNVLKCARAKKARHISSGKLSKINQNAKNSSHHALFLNQTGL